MNKNFYLLVILLLMLPHLVFGQSPIRGVNVRTKDKEQKRIALIIGNGAYTKANSLKNPVNDATDMALTLKELGFEVFSGIDVGKQKMELLIRDFGNRLKASGGVGLFYYAGHGVQVKGENFLIPVDADIPEEDEIAYRAVPMGLILTKMTSAKNDLNLVILDACRNNPFARSWGSYRDSVGGGGLAKISPPTGTLVLYSTEPGKVASDGEGRNGLFTAALLDQIKRPNLEYDQLVRAVSTVVWEKSGQQQLPWKEGNSLKTFYFTDATGSESSVPTPASGETVFWKTIENSSDPDDYHKYITKSKNGEFTGTYQATAELKLIKLMNARASENWPKFRSFLSNAAKYDALYWTYEDGILINPVRLRNESPSQPATGKYGFVDENGKLFIPFKYSEAHHFAEGLAGVKIGDLWGFIDKSDRVVIPAKYEGVMPFSEGLATVMIDYRVDFVGKYGVIDKTGREIVAPKYSYISKFSNGFAVVTMRVGPTSTMGFIDKSGREITPIKYGTAINFTEGLAPVSIGGKYGYVDVYGREAIQLKFKWARNFSEGLAAVQSVSSGKFGFIDKAGREIVPMDYDSVAEFSEGLASVRKGDYSTGKCGYIDKVGRVAVPFEFEQCGSFKKGYAVVTVGGKSGVIDKTGRILVVPRYDGFFLGYEQSGLFGIRRDGKAGFVDIYGNEFLDL